MKRIDKNFIVMNEFIVGDEQELFFSGEEIHRIGTNTTVFDILFAVGIFSSKSQARKNWKRSGEQIPEGFTMFTRIGKLKHQLTFLNPTKDNLPSNQEG